MANIQPIEDGEGGLSVRTKLNEAIAEANDVENKFDLLTNTLSDIQEDANAVKTENNYTDADAAKVAAITDTGSGEIITSSERLKISQADARITELTGTYYVRSTSELENILETKTDQYMSIELLNSVVLSGTYTLPGTNGVNRVISLIGEGNAITLQTCTFECATGVTLYVEPKIIANTSTISFDDISNGNNFSIYFRYLSSSGTITKALIDTGFISLWYNLKDTRVNGNISFSENYLPNLNSLEYWEIIGNSDLYGYGTRIGNIFSIEFYGRLRDQTEDDTVDVFPSHWTDKAIDFDKAESMSKEDYASAVTASLTINQFYDDITGIINMDIGGLINGWNVREATVERNDTGDGGTAYIEDTKKLPLATDVTVTINQDTGNPDGHEFSLVLTGTIHNI